MTILTALKTDDSIQKEKDSVGGFSLLDSGLYTCTVELAYLKEAASKALGLELLLKTDDGKSLRQTLWMTSGEAKGRKNYYEDKQGKKHYLAGFNAANSLALLTVGKEIGELDTEDKVINVYSYDAGAEVPTKVSMFPDLLGKQIIAGVLKQTVDKNIKNAAGVYVPSGETRDENEIDKFFRERDGMTVAEIRAQAEEATFKDTWETKWAGQVRNKAKGTGGNGAQAGAPSAGAPAAAKPAKSLFS